MRTPQPLQPIRITGATVPDLLVGALPVGSLLAGFPLPVFLTTNYDDFLVKALREQGKDPQPEVSPWWQTGTGGIPLIPEPTVDKPVVYHLHGRWEEPRSLVLTESVRFVDRSQAPTPLTSAL